MPVVPTVSGRQVESRGVQSAGLQTFSQPGIGDAFVRAGTEAIDVLGQAKTACQYRSGSGGIS